jgi:hypothetical protein
VITGAVMATAFHGRRAINDLKSKKRARGHQSQSAAPISRHPSHGSPTITWPSAAKGRARKNEPGRTANFNASSRSRDAR